ncbi:GerMN domain-containing protein [bacterium]|nr:GerMN domain-containing protein [bacterium]
MKIKHQKDNLPVLGALLGVGVLVLIAAVMLLRPIWSKGDTLEIAPGKAREIKLVFYRTGEKKKPHRGEVRVDKTTPVYDQVKHVVERMLLQPAQNEDGTLWPLQMNLRSIYLRKNGLLILDFEKRVQYNQLVGVLEERDALRSIIVTLVGAFEDVKKVKFLVGGQEADTLAGHMDISRTFDEKTFEDK